MAVKKVKKVAKKKSVVKKAAAKKVVKTKKGARYSCGVCGLLVTVDNVCGCVSTCDIICCKKQMKKKR